MGRLARSISVRPSSRSSTPICWETLDCVVAERIGGGGEGPARGDLAEGLDTQQAQHRQSAPAPELDFLGSRARILVEGREELGLVGMIEVSAGHMPPLHVHHAQDEGFYVVEGEVTLFPGREVLCGPGDFAWAPRGVPHAYRVGDRPARWLIVSSPGGFERFVADVAALEQVDPGALAAVAAEHDIEILGPPGMLP